MRTITSLGIVAAALAAGTVLAAASSGAGPTATTLRLYEHDTAQASLDLGEKGDSQGDQLVIAGTTYNRKGGTRNGTLAAVFTTVGAGPRGRLLAVPNPTDATFELRLR
jgi:hypothetical protein